MSASIASATPTPPATENATTSSLGTLPAVICSKIAVVSRRWKSALPPVASAAMASRLVAENAQSLRAKCQADRARKSTSPASGAARNSAAMAAPTTR